MDAYSTLTNITDNDKSILCVDEDQHMRERLATLLRMVNFDVSVATSVTEGLSLARQRKFDLILLDSYLIDGRKFFREIRRFDQRTPVLCYSG